jgi:hypothetical protein
LHRRPIGGFGTTPSNAVFHRPEFAWFSIGGFGKNASSSNQLPMTLAAADGGFVPI